MIPNVRQYLSVGVGLALKLKVFWDSKIHFTRRSKRSKGQKELGLDVIAISYMKGFRIVGAVTFPPSFVFRRS